MLKVSRKFEYGLHAIVYLAEKSPDEVVTVKEMAAAIGFSQEFMAKALQNLKKAGLAVSVQGVKGGYKLGRPADDITVADIGRATEGEPHLMRCSVEKGKCEIVETCPHRGYMFGLEHKIDSLMGETRVTSLLGHSRPKA
ncbi:Rrf2 family transcriptional regulator [Prosthecochloris sp. N3]|uniref:Rrf2 family transcriptional regulator n=1 Tax=Prosthecochloris ethylica TaxID=2743976 RepID=A0ABR9XTS8_9CHLB|nr:MULTISPECIES: Rrf2 family transcriptional regulator [Prosthecochloris]MEC9487487.1 Rrf2 family transcriptional regulator [Prosthecochloris sp.]MBF0587030.1 Rrf2 family transcriptional regulator [Prosthecochloris ethylica]MBF0637374.1 Rrf2 family transcriptional regulator [Prosthecochloris ethylica]NUK48130.1 Rrf2 family transcriptional regulator [Prosthecochloris ethylica]RNA65296.1 Rrf2 family transcriptional regulator [Prosthecochloris sp. ZM_2]